MSWGEEVDERLQEWMKRPWFGGPLALALGAACVGGSLWLFRSSSEIFPRLLLLGFAFFGIGLWILVTWRSSGRDAREMPLWWRIGVGAAGLAGVAAGLYVSHRLDG